MTDSEENELRAIVGRHIAAMTNDIIEQGPDVGAWPRDTGAITTIVVEVLRHQYRVNEDPA